MEGVVGVFQSRAAAENAIRELVESGFSYDSMVFLTPEATPQQIAQVPTTEAESPGIGEALTAGQAALRLVAIRPIAPAFAADRRTTLTRLPAIPHQLLVEPGKTHSWPHS